MKLSEIAEDVKVPQKPRQGPLRPQTGAGKHQDKKKAMKQGKEKHKKPFSEGGYDDQFSLGRRLERDNDFRNRERNAGVEHERNNYQVSINGRPWKVFADQRQAMNIARSLRMKGKEVEVYPTGANPSESVAEAAKKPNATTRHLRDYPVSDKDMAKPVKKPEKKKPEQGVAEGWGFDKWGHDTWTDAQKEVARKKKNEKQRAQRQQNKDQQNKDQQKSKQQGVAEGSTDLVQIEYWQQETIESGRWVKTKPMPRATAEKIVNSFERGEIVDVEQGVAEGYSTLDLYNMSPKEVIKLLDAKKITWDEYHEYQDLVIAGGPDEEDDFDYTDYSMRKGERGMEEGSLETDNMVSHIGQVIQGIYPRGGDKNTYMKLVAQEMPHVVRDHPKLFRRAFGMAYDRFFHIDQDDDQDDDFDYTDYSMRQGERGMEEGVAGPKQCWPGHRKVGTKPGTGKNAGKRVNDCEKIKKEDLINLNNLDDFNIYLELLDHMIKK